MRFHDLLTVLFSLVLLGSTAQEAHSQYSPAKLGIEKLPEEHEYQRGLRAYFGSLTEKELTVESKPFELVEGPEQPEDQYRMWLLALHLPAVEAAFVPASAFTLAALESNKGIQMPVTPHQSQMLSWLSKWDYPGNPHLGSLPLKRRAFILAAVDCMLLDYLYEHGGKTSARSDFLGGNLIWMGYTYKNVKDAIPKDARKHMETGMKKHVHRLAGWGPTGAMTDMDLFAAVGLRYVSEALNDDEINKVAETYVRRLFTDPRFFHPAGYFVDVGCFDTSYNGISLYFATWCALASNWPFARDAVEKGYRLRAHLSLPEPVGGANGPSHMSSRTSADSPHDQWNFPHRPYAAAMVTDEALHLAPLPDPKVLKSATLRVLAHLNGYRRPSAEKPSIWQESHWSGTLNFAHEHYVKGYYPRRLQLEQDKSPLLKPLYERPDLFQREFDRAFVIARYPTYAAVIHTGPVRGFPNGFGGGQLSALWAPHTGSTLLGRRRGMQGPKPDAVVEWRSWPVHSLAGTTAANEFFSSTSLARPQVETKVGENSTFVKVSGPVVLGRGKTATLQYDRTFKLEPKGVTIRTSAQSTEALALQELLETLPVFLHDRPQASAAEVNIFFKVNGKWEDAKVELQPNVTAIAIDRFGGSLIVELDRPRSVRIGPHLWVDGFQSSATCRSVLIDLLELTGKSKKLEQATIEYTLCFEPNRTVPEKKGRALPNMPDLNGSR